MSNSPAIAKLLVNDPINALSPVVPRSIIIPESFRLVAVKPSFNPPDYIFVTAWNYADTIKSKEEWFNGIWVTPLVDLRFF